MSRWRHLNRALSAAAAGATISLVLAAGATASTRQPFLAGLHAVSRVASTVPVSGPAAGDQNPYGTAVVPRSVGKLVRGNVLVSNFNDAANAQGTGSSIVEVSPGGRVEPFAVVPQPTATPAVGLTTALVALRSGYVIVGSLPAPGGQASAARAGALTVLDPRGRVVESFSGGAINGPWDMTAVDGGRRVVLFVTNVLNGTVAANGATIDRGTVVRITLQISPGHAPRLTSERVIATGFAEHTDPNALIVGPTGLAIGTNGVLYVADTAGNRIAAIPDALDRTRAASSGGATLTRGGRLASPLGLTIAPDGDVLTVNAGDGKLLETTPSGKQITSRTLVAHGAGDLFGLAVAPNGRGVYFVDDAGSGADANSLEILH
ncbi:MAG: hypothetical protein JOZ98_02390 [Solirubrobacterales bacterium]|nr:hypothetical protein [Solirubrobacterales bacterium]